jgi:hypothetical protein
LQKRHRFLKSVAGVFFVATGLIFLAFMVSFFLNGFNHNGLAAMSLTVALSVCVPLLFVFAYRFFLK